jgi:hypothetical protein
MFIDCGEKKNIRLMTLWFAVFFLFILFVLFIFQFCFVFDLFYLFVSFILIYRLWEEKEYPIDDIIVEIFLCFFRVFKFLFMFIYFHYFDFPFFLFFFFFSQFILFFQFFSLRLFFFSFSCFVLRCYPVRKRHKLEIVYFVYIHSMKRKERTSNQLKWKNC